MKTTKETKSIYMAIESIEYIDKEAAKQKRNFSFIASELIDEAIVARKKKVKS